MAYAEPEGLTETELLAAREELEKPDRKTRTHAAIALKIAGADLSEIAEVLGYASVTQARQAVEAGLASTVDDDTREKARKLAMSTLKVVAKLVRKAVISASTRVTSESCG